MILYILLFIIMVIKYYLNPTLDPKIYRESEWIIKNYGVTVIIDSSISCFSPLSNQHTLSTIQELLSAIEEIDLPCFDLIESGNPNLYVICSGNIFWIYFHKNLKYGLFYLTYLIEKYKILI